LLPAAALLAVLLAAAFVFLVSKAIDRGSPPVLFALSDFSLTDQHGREVSLGDLDGQPWVADFIFTRCTFTCPLLTSRMKRLGEVVDPEAGYRRVSITVDPKHDSPEILRAYAEAQGIADPAWLFLTGGADEIYELAVSGFRLPLDMSPPPGSEEIVLHSTRFTLVDARGRIRGYYDAFHEPSFEALQQDLRSVLKGR
jgi:protein SCO1/2